MHTWLTKLNICLVNKHPIELAPVEHENRKGKKGRKEGRIGSQSIYK